MFKYVAISLPILFFSTLTYAEDARPSVKPDANISATVAKPADAGVTKEEAKPETVTEAVETAKSMFESFKGGKYREGVAAVLVLLLFIWRRFASNFVIGKLSTWWVGIVTVILGFLGTIPEALTMDPFSWKTFIWSGLLTSGSAMLFWKTVGQLVLPKVFGEIKKD